VEADYYRGKRVRHDSVRFRVSSIPIDCVPADYNKHERSTTFRFTCTALIPVTIPFDEKEECWRFLMRQNITILDESKKQLLSANKGKINIATDGGVYNYTGNYGVVVSDGEQGLATNYGTLYSHPMMESLTRAKIYSMFPGIITLAAISFYCNLLESAHRTLTIYSNNLPMIQRVYRRRKKKQMVNQHKDPDIDIELQLLYELDRLKQRGNTVRLRHVRGHQEFKRRNAS
jgi:hypothetical protein